MKQIKLGIIFSSLFSLLILSDVRCIAENIKEDTTLDIRMNPASGDLKGEYKLDDSKKIQTGSLAIKSVSPFLFGEMDSSGKLVTKLNQKVSAYFPDDSPLDALGVEVHDLRGTGKGWILKAMLVSFKNEDGKSLTNFKLTIPTEKVATKSATIENIPTAKSIVFQDYGVNSEEVVMEAVEGKGMGKFTDVFKSKDNGSEEVTLFVPLTAYKGAYQGNILWSLSDVPQ